MAWYAKLAVIGVLLLVVSVMADIISKDDDDVWAQVRGDIVARLGSALLIIAAVGWLAD